MSRRASRLSLAPGFAVGTALLVLALMGSPATPAPGPGWRSEIADPVAPTGDFSSIALDASGRPHVCYVDSVTGSVRYAVRTASGWSRETVHANSHPYPDYHGQDSYRRTSIALDASGVPHVFYALHVTDEPPYVTEGWYAHRTGGTWHRERVTPDCHATVSLRLDSAGHPHVAFLGAYAHREAGVWIEEAVGGSFNHLDLDAADQPHIVYGTISDVRYTRKLGGFWTTEVLPAAVPLEWPLWVSFDLDALGVPHVVRYNFATNDFTYFWKPGGTWIAQGLDFYPASGAANAIATEPDGTPHVSSWYRGYVGHAVRGSSGWVQDYADPGVAGLARADGMALALDSHGMPHISYSEYSSHDLRVAWLPPPGVPDPDSSDVVQVALCPSGSIPMVVRVRDGYGDPLEGVKVELSFVLADTARLCGPDGSENYTFERGRYVVSKLTLPDGAAPFLLRGGGIAYARSIHVLADSVELGWYPVASCDQNGDGEVGAADAALFAAKVALGGSDPTADLDASGTVDLADLGLFNAHLALGEHCLGTVGVRTDPRPRLVLRGGVPNPLRERTVFSFSLPAPAAARIRVCDLAGRLVRAWQSGAPLPAGEREWRWDGHDSRGRRVPPGVYLVTLEALGQRSTTRSVVLD